MRKSKLIIYVIIFTFLSTLFVGIIMKIPRPSFVGGSEDGWTGYWGGLIGSAIGVIGAYLVMRRQIHSERKDREEEKNQYWY